MSLSCTVLQCVLATTAEPRGLRRGIDRLARQPACTQTNIHLLNPNRPESWATRAGTKRKTPASKPAADRLQKRAADFLRSLNEGGGGATTAIDMEGEALLRRVR